MTRRRRHEKEDEEIDEKVKEVVAKWSLKRIGIAIVLVFLAAASIYYYFSLKSYSTNNSAQVSEKKDKPQIEIPSKDKVNTIIEDAQKSLEHIDTNDIVKSQPQIEKIIKDLQELTTSSRSAKDIVCSAVCK